VQNRTILIFGSTGQVGWQLRRTLACLGPIVAVEFPQVDFLQPDSIADAIRAHRPGVIVNAAAYTAVDQAEVEQDRATAVNAVAPAIMADEARKAGALLVHYSTDYVFNGSGQEPWIEASIPDPLNVYGATKLAGDEAIGASGCEHLIFRTSWVYGARGNNFLLTMLKLAAERSELSIVHDQIGSPTTAECIAQTTASVLSQVMNLEQGEMDGRSGVYNLTNAGYASWCDFAEEIFTQAHQRMGAKRPVLKPILTSEFPRPAKRPLNSRLSTEKLSRVFGVVLPAWQAALSLVLESMEAQRS